VTIKDKIKEKLRKGTPLAGIRKESESVSKNYKALREFSDESEEIVEETQKRVEVLRNVQAEEEKRLSARAVVAVDRSTSDLLFCLKQPN